MNLPSRLSSLESAGLVKLAALQPEVEYLFRHALIQDAAYVSLVKADRRALHRAVAETLERLYPQRREALAPRLAQHFLEANEDRRACEYFTLAGDVAARVYANAEAAAHYAEALRLAHRLQIDRDHWLHLYLSRGQALELNAQYDEALANYAELQTLADRRHDQALLLGAVMALAKIYSTTTPAHDPKRAQLLLEQALALTHELNDRATESKVLWNLMVLNVFSVGDMQQAMAYGEQSLAIARELGLKEQLAFTLNDLVYAYTATTHIDEASAALEESRQLWRELGNLPMLSNNLTNSSIASFRLGDYDQSIAYSEEAYRISQSIDNIWGQASSRFLAGYVYFERGEIDRAIEIMQESTRLGERVGHPFAYLTAPSDLGWVYGSLGAIDRGLELAHLALQRADEMSPELAKPWVSGNLARLHILNHDLDSADRALQTGRQMLRADSLQLLALILIPLAEGELALARGDHQQAIAAIDQLIESLHKGRWQAFVAEALIVKGRALLGLDQIDAAYQVFSLARVQAEALNSRRTLWPILLALREIERDGALARSWLGQARTIIAYIADYIGDSDLRAAFLDLPAVRAVHNDASS